MGGGYSIPQCIRAQILDIEHGLISQKITVKSYKNNDNKYNLIQGYCPS